MDEEEPQKVEETATPGFGSSLWSRVAAAAGNLSVSVTKAWETNVAYVSGESEAVSRP